MNRFAARSSARIDGLAAAWVGRCDAGLTAAETVELAAWRAADPRHAAALEKFESIWSAADRPRNLGAAALVRQCLADRAHRRQRRRTVVSAGLAACLVLGVGLWLNQRPLATEPAAAVHTAFLGPERQILPDGSIAEYSPGTHLTVDFSGDTRRVTFTRGETHFQVAHNPARPFIVYAGGLAVRAVGTAFAVQVGSDSTAVLVTAGRVTVNPTTASVASLAVPPLATVDAGHSIDVPSASPTSAPVVVPLAATEMAARLAWRQRRVEFSSAPLADVVAVVNRHNRVQFSIDDPALARVPLSGVFRLDDPEEFARLLAGGFALIAERPRPDLIVLRPRHP